jgi:integrase
MARRIEIYEHWVLRRNYRIHDLRHTFASYHLAYHGSPDKTAHELGHRDTQMLYRHYRQLVTREAAEAFWAIWP